MLLFSILIRYLNGVQGDSRFSLNMLRNVKMLKGAQLIVIPIK